MTTANRRRACLAAVLVVAAAAPAFVFGTRQTGRAQIYATVVDDLHRPVLGLGSEDIVLRDGGVRQVSLAAERAADPLAIAVVIEGFDAADVPDLHRTLDSLVEAVTAGNASSEIGLMTAPGPSGRQVVMLTRTAPIPDAALSQIALERPAALIEALSDACLALRAAPTDRLVVLSLIRRRPEDGALSQPERLADILFRTRTALWTVEVGADGATGGPVRKNGLDQVLAAGTQLGGALRETVSGTPDMAAATGRIANVLLSQYVVTYTWPDPMLSQVSLTTRHDRGQVLTPAWSR